MKKSALHFLGRKNPSLFDTNVKMKDMDNVEVVLESPAIPESGTASVRARPTVKHHSSSFESFQGFAVPTPKVPLLLPVNGPKINGSVGGDLFANGTVISVPDLDEKEIFVPPPPSMAPPPPPGTVILPPPDFIGDLNSPDLAFLPPPSMPAPKPPPLAAFMEEVDVTLLKPPPMAPPKPPSTASSSSASSISIPTPSPTKVPEHPKFAPPQPPTERQLKTSKTPPPKPVRKSSISILDSPPSTPAPLPPVQTPTQSTFNPQNTAKLYNVPTASVLSGYEDRDTKPKQMLLLEDSGSVKSIPVLVQVDGKVLKVAPPTPSKPNPKDVKGLKENLESTNPSQSPLPEPVKEATKVEVSVQQEKDKPLLTLHQLSSQLQKVNGARVKSETGLQKIEEKPIEGRKISPLLDDKLRNLKSSETNGAREGPTASPLALLMAAKEREKHRSTVSRENSAKKNKQPSASIHQSDSSPNSFIVIPRSSTSIERIQESPEAVSPLENRQAFSGMATTSFPSASNLAVQKQDAEQSPSESHPAQPEDQELSMPLLPPPPEFGDFDEITDPPPAIYPPDPPVKKAPKPNGNSLHSTKVPPPPPTPNPPVAPKPPFHATDVKPKPHVQSKTKAATIQLPSSLSSSQATLLSILQKKMLEMDHKITPMKDADSNCDDWGAPSSSDENNAPTTPPPRSKSQPVVNHTPALNMRELEGELVRKHVETSSKKAATSNGPQSKHQYGMTFTVRPGTKQPITPFTKGDSS